MVFLKAMSLDKAANDQTSCLHLTWLLTMLLLAGKMNCRDELASRDADMSRFSTPKSHSHKPLPDKKKDDSNSNVHFSIPMR